MAKRLLDVAVIVVATAIAIAVALWVTPMQTVEAVGQTVRVGATQPSLSWSGLSWSGPGEVDLFGQELPTTIEFSGPIRPRLELTDLQLTGQLTDLAGPDSDESARSAAQQELTDALVSGWRNYLILQVLIVAAVTVLLLGAIAGWQRRSLKPSIAFVAVGALFAVAVNVGAFVSTAFSTTDQLRGIDSLASLVGAAPAAVAAPRETPTGVAGKVVVIGDSTAAGIGNPALAAPTREDSACERTSGSFAVALDRSTGWEVANLACSSATIREGLLGDQERGGDEVPPQLPRALADAPGALIISVGANDVRWSQMIGLCATLPDCGGAATDAYFRQQLSVFTRDYLVLLTQLRSLPNPPTVVINQYYDPLSDDTACVRDLGITEEKEKVLRGWLQSLNTVLAEGARASSFQTALPSFAGHGVCSTAPFVQSIDGAAPLHPTTAGGLAIALADQAALLESGFR
ncbi:GDSL-type esterase/lipase family protein [Gordonia sp. HY285]|uniref:GDSL-type esterase/lipase family protein n=1 Tax=Gordonia liuliyuniae TaxID=2911517 RepID=UPI001F1A01AE|nr:GDSL-type esterase/lipase family protein [Gordonia liuliyuniae]MCF8611094.1 GDSL-type esterase/lipase family protein [Gordonia liuliyuniae]